MIALAPAYLSALTGVAGGLVDGQKVGDIILGVDCVNYDMDVTAFEPFPGCKFARGQVRCRQRGRPAG